MSLSDQPIVTGQGDRRVELRTLLYLVLALAAFVAVAFLTYYLSARLILLRWITNRVAAVPERSSYDEKWGGKNATGLRFVFPVNPNFDCANVPWFSQLGAVRRNRAHHQLVAILC
jgi:hypothetical protein